MTTPEKTQTPAPADQAPRYEPGHIANYMLLRAKRENRFLSPLKLQKMVYISYGWAQAVLDRKLFDEPIQAWRHGPVIPSLYHEFKHYGWAPIRAFSWNFNPENEDPEIPEINSDDEDAHSLLDVVWDIYKDFSARNLQHIAHKDDTPWSKTIQSEGLNAEIAGDEIKSYYKGRIQEYLRDIAA